MINKDKFFYIKKNDVSFLKYEIKTKFYILSKSKKLIILSKQLASDSKKNCNKS